MAKKRTPTARPQLGAGSQQLVVDLAHGLAPDVRTASGLASALLALYQAKLANSEAEYERLGNLASGDGGERYHWEANRVQELRGLVPVLALLGMVLKRGERRSTRLAELTRKCRGGDQ